MSRVKEEKTEEIEKNEKEETTINVDIEENNEKTSNVVVDTNGNTQEETICQEEIDVDTSNVAERIEDNEKTSNVGIDAHGDSQEETIYQEANTEQKDGLQKYTIAISVIAVILFIAVIIFSTVFGLKNRKSDKIVNGISIKGIDVSGLTKEEARNKINELVNKKTVDNISLVHGDYEISLIPEQIEAKFGIEDAVDMAYSVGRSGKLLKDNYSIVNSYLSKIKITPSFTYNDEALTKFISGISENLPDTVKQSDYYIDNNNLIIYKGKTGVVVKEEELKKSILENITNLKSSEEIIDIPTEAKEPEAIDLQKIYNEIHKEAQDAYYTKEPFTVHPHVNGVDFNISMEEAISLLNGEAEEVTIPLKITKPKVTTNQIGTEAFPNLLASYSTTFSTSNGNRSTNIRIASNKINGVVLMPGEQFSYNTAVGKRTAAAGFKPAAAYSGGKVVQELGGGICQVSSTLYNSVLRANLEIVKRSNHRFATGYVPLSTDATVSWGGPEFVFKNSRKYPIKIVSSVSGGRIKVDIYGCKEEVEYEVQIKSETLQTIPMKTVYRTNTALPAGTQKTVQKGHGGYKSRAYRILKLNGQIVSKQLLSTDTYAQLETIIEKN